MNNLLSQSFNFSQLEKVRDSYAAESVGGRGGPGKDLTEFNGAVEQTERGIQAFKAAIREIKALSEQSQGAVKASSIKANSKRIQHAVLEASRMAKAIKDRIEALKRSNEDNRKFPGCQKGSPVDRHRSAVTLSLARSLKAVVDDFNALRERMERQQRDTMGRRVQVLTGQQLDEADLDRIVRTGRSDDILRAAVQQQGYSGSQSVREVILEIEERSLAVSEITRSLEELHQMMVDMAVLVESQQETLDQLENNVGEAHVEVKAGTKQLVTALETKRNTRKWICIGTIAVLIILLVIFIPIILSMLKK